MRASLKRNSNELWDFLSIVAMEAGPISSLKDLRETINVVLTHFIQTSQKTRENHIDGYTSMYLASLRKK